MTTVSYFTISFALTLWLSRFLLRYVEPTMFMDHPSDRKIHAVPKPRFGGIAFGTVIIIIGWFLLNWQGQYSWYFLGAIGIFILGAVDDYWSVTWRYKLPVQLLIGGLVASQFLNEIHSLYFFGFHLTSFAPLLFGLYLFWFIGILNAVNLIDGMDGLAGGFMFLTAFGGLVIGGMNGATEFVYMNSIVMGAMAAFLHFNQRPAKFFMGDSGSLLLGYHVAVLPLLFYTSAPVKNGLIEITPFLILTSYMIVDTIRVFYTRLRHRTHPLEPDQTHLHHLMLKNSGSYNGTLLMIFLFLGISGITAIASLIIPFGEYLMILYLFSLALFCFVPAITEMIIKAMTGMIRLTNQRRSTRLRRRTLLRIRLLPVLTISYLVGLFLVTFQQLFDQSGSTLLLASVIFILLYILRGSMGAYKSEVILIGIGIIQGFILNTSYTHNISGINSLAMYTGTTLRYISLALIAVITLMNYVLHTKNLSGDFWSATDLLVLFMLVGMSSIQSLGVGIPAMMSFELGIVYFANKLYMPKLLNMSEWASESSRV